MKRATYYFLSLSFLFAVACSGASDSSKSGDVLDDIGQTTRAVIGPDGGELATPSRSAVVVFPRGAVGAPTEFSITGVDVSQYPDAQNVGPVGFDLKPDGFRFNKLVRVSLAFDEALPAEYRAVVSWFDEATTNWSNLPSLHDQGRVDADVDHFTVFTVRRIDFAGSEVNPLCSARQTFSPCGGDPQGPWDFAALCLPPGLIEGLLVSQPGCDDALVQFAVDEGGVLKLNADGSFTSTAVATSQVHLELDEDCVDGFGPTAPGPTCTAQLPAFLGGSCTYQNNLCTCDSTNEQTFIPEAGSWSTNNTTLTLDTQTVDYCVDGNTMILRTTQNGQSIHTVFVRP